MSIQDFCNENNLPQYASFMLLCDAHNIYCRNENDAEREASNHFASVPIPAPAKPATNDLFSMLAAAINPHMQQQAAPIDEQAVIALIKQYAPTKVDRTEITVNGVTNTITGRQHHQFETVLKVMSCGVNVYLYGDAGTGKSQLAENAAMCLGKDFYALSVCSQSTKSDLLGYMNAGGTYTGTLFRQAFEHGGVFLLDEIDNGNPNVLAVLNSALANNYCAFPDKMVKKHSEFMIIASANTFGTGADAKFVGRCQLDAATLNRFVQLPIGYDEGLEQEIFGNEIAEPIQKMRARLAGERVVISMRNIGNTSKLMQAFTKEEAMKLAVINTIPENLRSRI